MSLSIGFRATSAVSLLLKPSDDFAFLILGNFSSFPGMAHSTPHGEFLDGYFGGVCFAYPTT